MIDMKKLSSTMVLGQKVKIKYEADLGNWGECDHDAMTIKLSEECLMDPKLHFMTLAHEVTHLILRMSGIAYMEANDEEAYVRCIENLIIPWVLENQSILAEKK
jgi:hypothetical protein